MLEGLLLDNGYLTDVRTAAAGAVAARHLARADANRVCVIGAGVQARLQLKAVMLVRPIKSAVIWARDSVKANATAADLRNELGLDITASTDAAGAVASADIVITTTPAATPLIRSDWLQPGQLVIAMGADQEHKTELDPDCLTRADLYVPDSQSQCAVKGELRSAIEGGPSLAGPEIRRTGRHYTRARPPGADADSDIIIADLTGTGVQDTAIATVARQRAEAAGRGASFTSLTQRSHLMPTPKLHFTRDEFSQRIARTRTAMPGARA